MSTVRNRIQQLEKRVRESVGRMANGVSTEEIHAMMGWILTDPVAHDAAAELGERLCGFGALGDSQMCRKLIEEDGRSAELVQYIYNLRRDVR